MATYEATVRFDLPDGDGIDAATGASMLGERLFSEDGDIVIDALSVKRVGA